MLSARRPLLTIHAPRRVRGGLYSQIDIAAPAGSMVEIGAHVSGQLARQLRQLWDKTAEKIGQYLRIPGLGQGPFSEQPQQALAFAGSGLPPYSPLADQALRLHAALRAGEPLPRQAGQRLLHLAELAELALTEPAKLPVDGWARAAARGDPDAYQAWALLQAMQPAEPLSLYYHVRDYLELPAPALREDMLTTAAAELAARTQGWLWNEQPLLRPVRVAPPRRQRWR